jgi:hypothetical protein
MLSARTSSLALIGLALFVTTGFAPAARSGESPNCTGAGQCAPIQVDCEFADTTVSSGPIVVADFPDGLSSDGRGPYIKGADGVVSTDVGNAAALTIWSQDSLKPLRTLTVNLNNPVPGGGGVPFGILTDKQSGEGIGLHTQRYYAGDTAQNLNRMRIGQRVAAAQLNVSFHVNGRKHLLQMGPQPNGHCHGATLINGTGTSSGTIFRASQTKWVVDLPARSVGRLFDIADGPGHAVDKGLYYVHVHYEIGK